VTKKTYRRSDPAGLLRIAVMNNATGLLAEPV
jgi:hypothetical protein